MTLNQKMTCRSTQNSGREGDLDELAHFIYSVFKILALRRRVSFEVLFFIELHNYHICKFFFNVK